MTNQETIASLRTLCHNCKLFPKCAYEKPECFKAIELAISALQAQDSPKPTAESVQNVQNEDLISRKAAIEVIEEMQMPIMRSMFPEEQFVFKGMSEALSAIKDLPSAQPETAKRIVGKSRDGMTLWYQCDMCNEPVDAQDNFCRGCGRRLTDG